MILGLLIHSIAGSAGLWLASRLLGERLFYLQQGGWAVFILAGLIYGLCATVLKPVRMIFTGLVYLVLCVFILLIIDIIFVEINLIGIAGLVWATLIVFACDALASLIFKV
jgi:hypothetical protein